MLAAYIQEDQNGAVSYLRLAWLPILDIGEPELDVGVNPNRHRSAKL